MRALFIGGGKSGKSTAAQKLAAALADGGPLYYWATMTPHDGEVTGTTGRAWASPRWSGALACRTA